jgi:hypothetical protein
MTQQLALDFDAPATIAATLPPRPRAPFARESVPSRQAARLIAPLTNELRERVYQFIAA